MLFNLAGKQASDRTKNRSAWLQLDDCSPHPVSGPCSIGRAKTNSVSIPCEKISRLHALVHLQERAEHWLIDLGSSNGTYLNGRRVIQPLRLHDGDLIQLGEHTIRFFLKEPETSGEGDDSDECQVTVRETREVPCWFMVVDIENFVTLSETMPADSIARAVGDWFATCNRVVLKHQGTINQYLGDGFVAYWDGRKVPPGEVAACLNELKEVRELTTLPFRVALHFGKAGMGASRIMGEAGLFGQDVNMAFGLEKLAKSLSVPCILSEAAYDAFARPISVKPLGPHMLHGFAEKRMLYQLPLTSTI